VPNRPHRGGFLPAKHGGETNENGSFKQVDGYFNHENILCGFSVLMVLFWCYCGKIIKL
jgi:hypothetical protein